MAVNQAYYGMTAESQATHLRFVLGSQVVDFDVMYVPLADVDTFTEMKEHGFGRDEDGIFRKIGGQRVYFSTESYVNQKIAELRDEVDYRHYFDPTSESNPASPYTGDASIRKGEIFVVTADGTWAGEDFKKGDILEATEAIADGSTATLADFYYNEAVPGIENLPVSSETVAGIIKKIHAIRTDGSATHEAAATEKAVADLVAQLQSDLTAAYTAADAALQTQIDTISGQAATNASDIDDAEARLDALEAADQADFVKYQSDTEQVIVSDIKIAGAAESVDYAHFTPANFHKFYDFGNDVVFEFGGNGTIPYNELQDGSTRNVQVGDRVVFDAVYDGTPFVGEGVIKTANNGGYTITTDTPLLGVAKNGFNPNNTSLNSFQIQAASEANLNVTGSITAGTYEALPQDLTGNEDKQPPSVAAVKQKTDAIDANVTTVQGQANTNSTAITALQKDVVQQTTLEVGGGLDGTESVLVAFSANRRKEILEVKWQESIAGTWTDIMMAVAYKRTESMNNGQYSYTYNFYFASNPSTGRYRAVVTERVQLA